MRSSGTRSLTRIEDGHRGRHREGDLLDRRGARLLQVVRADVDRVPLRHLLDREGDHVRDQLHRGAGRERVGAPREVLLDDVVLGGALERCAVDAVVLGRDDVEREQPGGRGVDRHRRVHLVEWDAVQQGRHVALVGHRHADLADLAARELVIGVVARLRGQVEGDRKARLALREVRAVQLVGLLRRGVTRVRAHHPRAVGLLQTRLHGQYLRSPMRVIDTKHLGRERVIGCWQVDDVLIDPGPESTLDTLLAGLGEGFEPRAVLLTHIHFDHAGASGALVARWPDLPVYVHEVGAPHLADPTRLVRSATRLYGEEGMQRLWGEVMAVPESNLEVLSGGETVLEDFQVRVHAGPRLPPRLLPARADRRGLRRGRRRRAHPARDARRRADAAARHRRRRLARVPGPDRRLAAAAPRTDPLRLDRRGHRRITSTRCAPRSPSRSSARVA